MCKIGINLAETTPNGTNIVSAIGQYRLVGGASWINFTIILNNPETPDLTEFGSYELRVNVTNNVTDTSEWSNIVTYNITDDCNPAAAPCVSTQPYVKYEGYQKRRYTSATYTEPSFNIGTVQCGTKIRIWIHFKANGSIAYSTTYDKTFTTTKDYSSVEDWFNDQVVTLGAWGNTYTSDYGFTSSGDKFFVTSHRNGTSSRDVTTELSFEFGLT